MVTIAQRIAELRTQFGLSRPALAEALGLPRNAIEKFETGRQTPTKEQQDKLAGYFGVSLFYLRGESGDPTRQEDWMSGAYAKGETGHIPAPPPPPKPEPAQQSALGGTVLDTVLASKQVRELLRAIVMDTLRSPEGQEVIGKAVRKELAKQGR